MKTILNILSYLIVIVVTYIVSINSDKEVDKLHKENDSLYKSLQISSLKLNKLDSLTVLLKKDIQTTKLELSSLQTKSKKIKQQYDAQTNRINNLSNTTIIIEFTEAFK